MTPSPRYLLDTNIVSELARHPDGAVSKRIAEVGADRIAISLIVACEIRFGLAKSTSERLKRNVEAILAQLEVLPLESPVEEHYADIRLSLETAGLPIGPNDLLIAAHARALDITLVTNNAREFERVRGLAIENWLND